MALRLFLISLLVCSVVVREARAAAEFVPIMERAQGQALGGGTLLNDSLYSNPAASAFSPVYIVEGTYLLPKTFAVSILDTRTSVVGGALGYFRQKVDSSEEPFQGAKLALSGKLAEWMSIGMAGKMLWGPDFQTGDAANNKDIDLGVLAKFSFIQFGLTGRNLFGGEPAFDMQREMVLGTKIAYQDLLYFSAATTARNSEWTKPYQVGVGAEYISPHFFGLRGGYRYRLDSSNGYWSAGASFLGPKFLVHYAVEFGVGENNGMEHTFAAALLF